MNHRTKIKFLIVSIVYLVIVTFSCNSEHGIAPKPNGEQEFGFGGNIVFYGAWPDSIRRMVLIVFKNPLTSPNDFVLQNIRLLSLELPLNVQSIQYSSIDSSIIPLIPDDISPSVYNYVVVAQQSTDEVSLARKDWFVSGVYYAAGDTSSPGILTIPEDTYIENVNIYCDFDNPPPQPPGGN